MALSAAAAAEEMRQHARIEAETDRLIGVSLISTAHEGRLEGAYHFYAMRRGQNQCRSVPGFHRDPHRDEREGRLSCR